MIVRHGFAPRARGLTPEQAQHHWRSTHGDMAAQIPGLRRYVQNHALLVDGRPLLPWPGFDIYAETEFDSVAAMEAGFASDQYQVRIRADETVLIDRDRFTSVICRRAHVTGGDPGPGATKLISMFRLRPGAERARLVEALVAGGREALRHEVHAPVPVAADPARPGADPAPEPAFDAVDELWFPDPGAAVEAVRGDLYRDLAGIVLGSAMVIVRPRLVVGPPRPS